LLLLLAASAAVPERAQAGGFYLGDRGVRGTGRAGALIAGADAPDSLWYNPAGLAWSGRQLQVDATLVLSDDEFTRIDGGGEWQPTVHGQSSLIPLPGIFYSENFGLEKLTFGVGLFTPTAALDDWPETITRGGVTEPAPQRYSLISTAGTAMGHIAVGAAWRPLPRLSIGVTAQLIAASFRVRSAVSGCDRAICTQPENPDYDAIAEVSLSSLFAATFGLGAIYDAGIVRFGASFLTPYTLAGDATIRVRLPSAAAFDGAHLEGDQASTSLAMPWILRAGVELRPVTGLRVEVAVVGELWSTQQEMVVLPHDMWMRDVLALGDYQAGPVTIPRKMRDTLSLRLGGEYTTGIVGVRAGVSYENGAFDDAYLSPLTLDTDDTALTLGASLEVTRGFFVDVSFQHFFMRNRQVRNSAVPQANPVRPPPADVVYVGNGDYAIEASTVGLGVRWAPGAPRAREESN
jgi:long-chain fatty acid transport protein